MVYGRGLSRSLPKPQRMSRLLRTMGAKRFLPECHGGAYASPALCTWLAYVPAGHNLRSITSRRSTEQSRDRTELARTLSLRECLDSSIAVSSRSPRCPGR